MPETFLPLTHLTLCSTLSMGWNLTPISSCHPEWSLTVTVKPPWGNWVQAAAEAKKKKKKMQCMAIHRSGLLLGGMQGGSCRAPCAMSYPDLVFSTTAEFAGLQSRGSFLWLLHGYIVPIWLRCQPATRDQPSCYCDRSVIFCFLFFPVAWSALSREIIASALCQVLIPLKSVTLLQLTSAGPGLK